MLDDKVSFVLRFKGGKGSGDFGHKGRKGFVGGSASSATGSPYSPASEAAFDKTFGKGSHAKLSQQDQADWRRGVKSVEDFQRQFSSSSVEDDVDADGVPNGYTTNQAKDFIKLSFRQSTQFTMSKMPKLATEAFGLALKAGKKYGISVEELSALAEEVSN